MIVNRHDYHKTENGAYGVGYDILNYSAFAQDELNALKLLLDSRKFNYGPGVVVLDCGANLGVHTVECAKHMHGWGEVTAIEAQERVFYALAGNIAINNCFNARAIWAAVGEVSGVISVPEPNYFIPSSFGSLEIKQRDYSENIGQAIDYKENLSQTKIIPIDELGFSRLDFIKMDVEGMEAEALTGAKTTIARFKPQLFIEKAKSDTDVIAAFLTDFGYKFTTIGINFLAIHETDPAISMISAE